MASQTRQHIAEYLAVHGPVDDPAGRATSKLRVAVNYEGSDAGFTQLLAAMERSGQLTRETRGKRTYRISAVSGEESSGLVSPLDGDSPEMDYEQIAAALLLRVVETIHAGGGQRTPEDSWARRRIEKLERANAELERALSRAKAESRVLTEERDDLRQQLERTAGNLEILTERLEARQSDRLSKRLGTDEQALLHQLRRQTPRDRTNQAG